MSDGAGFTQTSTGILDIDVTGAHVYDVLAVSGEATLAGILDLYFSGYLPQVGDVYTVLTAGSSSGTFTVVDLVNVFGETYNVVYNTSTCPATNACVQIDVTSSAIGAVPEPTSWMLLAAGFAGLLLYRTRCRF